MNAGSNLELFNKPMGKSGGFAGPVLNPPLAELLRPSEWESFAGLGDIKGDLIKEIRSIKKLPSLIFWGPPGCGKTTLAKLIGKNSALNFVEFSAVLGGVKEVRQIVEEASKFKDPTILFIDEIHRFNKAQQDAFLPHVERGTIILFGATTENPSFYLNQALLSRARVIVLPPLSDQSLLLVLERAISALNLKIDNDAQELLISFASGDARRLLNLIESLAGTFNDSSTVLTRALTADSVKKFIGDKSTIFYDRDGEEHYNLASAFIKSLRGSDPDGALYWGFRMLEGGEDPLFLCRRMIIFASEDIGNADPRALQIATSTILAFERIGMPEGRIPIAQCITYLATAPKSNRSYEAMNKVVAVVKERGALPVPLHLRNAPTRLMKELDYGADYQYPHKSESGYIGGITYLPDELKGGKFYEPKDSGYEKIIFERQERLKGNK